MRYQNKNKMARMRAIQHVIHFKTEILYDVKRESDPLTSCGRWGALTGVFEKV